MGTYGNLLEHMGTSCMGTYENLWELCAWELMVIYGSFVHGNLWEPMGTQCVGTYGNLLGQKS